MKPTPIARNTPSSCAAPLLSSDGGSADAGVDALAGCERELRAALGAEDARGPEATLHGERTRAAPGADGAVGRRAPSGVRGLARPRRGREHGDTLARRD